MSRKKSLLTLVLLLLFAGSFVFNSMTPLVADDYTYCFSFDDWSRITSPGQIPASMRAHRVSTNGRVLPHTLVQLFLMLPKPVFNLVNAFNAALLGFLIWLYARRRAGLVLLAAFAVWNSMPDFGQVFLWLDGAVNYSWGLSLFLLFLWPYAEWWTDGKRSRSWAGTALRIVLAFAAGAWSENGSLAAMFAAVCLVLLSALRDRRIPWESLAWLAAALGGYLFLMSAPALSGRSGEMTASHILYQLRYVLSTSKETLLPLYMFWAAALALAFLSGADRRKLTLSAVLMAAGLGSLCSFFFAAYFAPRHLCFTVLFSVLAILIVLASMLEIGKRALTAATAAAMAVLFVFNLALGALDIGVIYSQSRRREAAIREAIADGQASVTLPLYTPTTRYSAPWGLTDLSPDAEQWPNDNIASYYGLDSVVGVERE